MKTTLFRSLLVGAAVVTASALPAESQVTPVVAAKPSYFDQEQESHSEAYGHSHHEGGGMGSGFADAYGSGIPGGECPTGVCGRRSLLGGRFLSRIQPSEGCFDDFISPVTNPIYFEDPRNLTEVRPLFINHVIPGGLGGGTVNVYAMQLRARLSENVSFIAVKDGYITSTSPLLNDGWADLGAGLKFNLIRDIERQLLWSAGFTYEAPIGSNAALQGLGAGNLNLFSSAALRLSERSFFMSASGIRAPMNSNRGSTSMFNSFHYSYRATQRLYALTELNWFRWIGSGEGALPVEGFDLANLGSAGVTGNNIATWAYGLKFKPNRSNEVGFAYEIPVTGRRDIFGNRVTVDFIRRF